MTLFVNNIELRLFSGAKVIDAVRAYYRTFEYELPRQLPVILDNYGNTLEPDGALTSFQRIYLIDHQIYNNE